MKGKTKRVIRSIGKKILAICTSAVLAFTTVMSTMPTLIHANDDEVKIARDEVSNITVKSIADFDQNSSIDYLMDNDVDTFMDSNYNNHNNENLQWYQFELNEEVNVSRVRIHPRKGIDYGRPNSYKIYAGTDADNLGLITEGSIDPTVEDWTDIAFEPVTARFVKVELTTPENNFNEHHVITAAEVELYKTEIDTEPSVEEVYVTEGYQDADGYVYLKLNGKPEKITSVGFVITEIDGEYYAVSNKPLSALTYDDICLAGSTDKRIWSYFYVNEDGTVDVCSEYNLQDPTIYVKVGDEIVNINTKEDYSITIPETFTDVPYVHVESVDISEVTVRHAIPSEDVLDIEVTGNHQSVDIPLINKSAQEPKSGLFALSFHYASNGSKYFEVTVNYDDSCVEARTTLDNTIKEAEALNETDYTAKSWKTLQDAVTAGKEVADNNIATKEVITNATDTIDFAIQNLVEEVKVDKTELNKLIEQCQEFKSDHETFEILENTLKEAIDINDSTTATQEEVDNIVIKLEAHYYLVKVAELNSEYDYDTFDYSSYKTETVTPVIRMLGITRNRTNVNYSENAENKGQMKGWYEEYQKAIKGLQKATDTDKFIGFNPESDSSSEYQGNFSIISEENVEGKIKITVRFDNDGQHPIYGESRPNANGETDYKGFSSSDMAKLKATVYVWNENFGFVSSSGFDEYQKLDGENNYSDGFIATKVIDNDKAKYITLRYYKDSFDDTQSPWYYKLNEAVDSSKLQALYDKYKDYKSDSAWYEQKFIDKLEKAKNVLDNPNATQKEIDTAYNDLDKAYWLCEFGEVQKKFKFKNNIFDYSSYTTESIIPLYKVYEDTNNYNWNTDIELIKEAITNFKEAEKNLVQTSEVNIMRGLTEDGINIDNRGTFTVEQTDVFKENGVTKVKLHVEYYNTGIDPITGEDEGKFSTSDMRTYAENLNYRYKTISGARGTKPILDEDVVYLDDKTSYLDGFQCDVVVESGIYSFYSTENSNTIATVGEFYTSIEVPDDGTIIISDNGNDETGIGTAESPVASLKKALELVEDGGTISLASDITLDKTEITINKDITINGNGNRFIRPSDMINATTNMVNVEKAEVSFENITLDAKAMCKAVLNVKNGAVVTLGKDVIITGITKNSAPIVMVDNASLNINGGSITKASGNGLKLVNNATVELIEGSITNNKLAGVWVTDGSTFTMNGGTISNNRTGVSHDAGSSSKVYLNAGVISENTNELDVDLIADGNSYIEVKKGVVQGNLNVLNRTQHLVLTEDYKDIRLGRGNEEKFDTYVKAIKDINASIEIPSGLKNLMYRIQPSTSEVKLSVSKHNSVEDEKIFVFYVPVTANGDVDTTREIIMKENVTLTDDYIDISSDKLVENTAYVLLVGNNQVDTSKLQTLVDAVDDYERNTGIHNNEFKPAFEKAQEILSNQNSATQEEVDNAYAALDKAYARCQIQDYILDYYNRPYEKYADYTTDSALALYQTLGSAQSILDENTLTTDELKAYIKDLDDKKAALVKVEEGIVKVEKGINKEAVDNKNNVGYFTVTEEANGDKVILHVEYHNDGINHLINEELGILDLSTITNYRAYIKNNYYTDEENGSHNSTRYVKAEEFKPLNGETDFTIGFQFDYETDPGNITFELRQIKPTSKSLVYSIGTYLTDVDKNAPEVLSIKKLDDGTIRVEFNEPVEMEDTNWKKSDKSGEKDGSVWIGTLTEDKFYEVAAKDLAGNSMTFTVDHKAPVVNSISYSETKLTNKDVKVTINFDEYISVADTQLNSGWKYDVNHLKATKTFSENTTEDVTFIDKIGNKVTVKVEVNNIDKEAPTANIISPNPDGTIRVKFSEPVIIDDENWEMLEDNYEEDGVLWVGTLTENKIYQVEARDFAGNKVIFDVDHEAPVADVKYETLPETGEVKVTINFADEAVYLTSSTQNPGWNEEVMGHTFTKVFNENTVEIVNFHDTMDNKTNVEVRVDSFDKDAPKVEVTYSNDNGNQVTKDDVTVTLTANEAIKDIEGWERTSDNTLTKVFSENGKYSVDVYDLAGNMTTVNFEVKRIDRIAPVITLHGVEPDGTTKETVTYSITEQSISKIVIDGVEYNEKNAPKEISGVGTHTIRVIDKAGNEASVSFTIVESVKPTVTVKESSKGTEGHYSYLDLKLFDASGIDYVVVNGVKKDLVNNTWSDLNDANVNYVEGHNVVEVYDIYGNKAVFEFDYDTVAPEVAVKDSSKGTDGYYSYLDLKLHDNKAIDYVIVNGVKKDLANDAWSDLNDANVSYVEGHNVVEVYDIYGNKTIFEFDYDTTAPVIFAKNITIKKNSSFNPLNGVKATDDGKDITSSIIVEENHVNTRKTGKYEVRYSVTDLAGNTTEKSIIVTVERKSCWENFVDIVEDTIKVVDDIVHGILDWIF